MPTIAIHPLEALVPEELWPGDVFADLADRLAEEVGFTEVRCRHTAGGLALEVDLAVKGEVELSIPGVNAVKLVIGAGLAGWTTIPVQARIGTASSVSIENLPIALRFSRDILTPTDPNQAQAEIVFNATVRVDGDLNVTIEAGQSLSLPECEIAGSGVHIAASDVTWNFSRGKSLPTAQAAGIDGEFLGVAFRQAVLTLPPDLAGTQLSFDYACIGTGGFTGGVAADFSQAGDPPPNVQIGGFQVELQRIAVRFQESRLVMGEIEAVLRDLPLFDADVAVDIQLGGGGLRVALSAAEDRLTAPHTRGTDGLLTLRKPDLISLTVSSAEVQIAGGLATLRLGGRVQPELTLPGGIRLPGFEVEGLSISSDGRVGLGGGMIDLPRSARVSLAGFGLELTRVGLGSEADGSHWVAFSGSLSLTEGLPATAAVNGLKVRWDRNGPLAIELAGIALAFEIEGVLRFSGSVRYTEAQLDGQGNVVEPAHFEGGGSVELIALRMTVSAQVLIGKRDDYDFLFIHLLLQSPVGVPLFSTGLAFYGLEALYARHLEPDKAPEERWFRDWYLRPEVGAVDTRKWTEHRGAQAFGAGILLGTVFDTGYTLATKGLLVVLVPGPILLMDLRANLLRDPTALARPDAQALFTALIVFDGGNGTIEIGIEPRYSIPDSGALVEIAGIAEAFYSFNDPRAWYVYLGRRERDRRIRASLLKFFEANAYLMIDPDGVELGGFIGYDDRLDAGPVVVALRSFIEGSAAVSRRPPQFKGSLHMEAGLEFSVAGIGFGLGLAAMLEAQAPQPFEVEANLAVHVGLPFPIPDLDFDVTLRWVDPGPPRVTAPLQSVSVEHFPSGASWALGADEPVVPLDGRLALVFERAVYDLTGRGLAAGDGEDTPLGDYNLRASLADLSLEVEDDAGAWQPYQSVDSDGNPVPFVGVWQQEPGDHGKRNRRLLLWVRTPLSWSRSLSDSTVGQLTEADLSSYCEPEAVTRVITFDAYPNAWLDSLQTFPYAGVAWTLGPAGGRILEREAAAAGHPVIGNIPRPPYRCLLLPDQTIYRYVAVDSESRPVMGGDPTRPPAPDDLALQLTLPNDHQGVAVLVLSIGAWSLAAFDANGARVGRADWPAPPGSPPPPDTAPFQATELSIRGRGIRRVIVDCVEPLAILTVALHVSPSPDSQRTFHESIEAALQERFQSTEPVFEPNRHYRLTVTTRVEDTVGQALDNAQVEGATDPEVQRNGSAVTITRAFLFRTEGPPGAADLGETPDAKADLNTLAAYVDRTMPDRGAANAYRNYDLGVDFNVDYLEQMYRSNNQALEIHLRSDAGEELALTNELGRGTELVLRDVERLWLELLGRYCGLTILLDTIVRDTVVRARLTHSLAPRRRVSRCSSRRTRPGRERQAPRSRPCHSSARPT